MLNEITVKNLGVIEHACLNLSNKITIISGETGAGKSIVLGALGLLLGKRADPALVRVGSQSASVEGIWDVNGLSIQHNLLDTGAELEAGEIFINRTISRDGKSRLIVGGKTTPVSVFSKFSEELVTIHGQADQMRLKDPVIHREMLDKFGGEKLLTALADYQEAYKAWRNLNVKIRELKSNSVSRERELDELGRAVTEIDKWSPQPDEDQALLSEITVLSNVEELQSAVGKSLSLLNNETDEPDVSTLLHLAVNELGNVQSLDPKVNVAYEKLLDTYGVLSEMISELSGYLSAIDVDALQRFNEAQERLASLNSLKRRYGPELSDVLTFLKDSKQKLSELSPENNDLEAMETELLSLSKDLRTKGAKLSELRQKAAALLEEAVNKELSDLAMRGNDIIVEVKSTEKYSSTGKEEIEFLMRTPGNPIPRPIHKSASGGELSRIMLGLAIVLRDTTVPTIVFDEIDSGVSGVTAQEIGKKIANLSTTTQVIQVSHLPQIAIYADTHFVIEKELVDGQPLTTVREVKGEERVKEIARMLAGNSNSESALAHAEELLKEAEEFKKQLTN